VRTNGAAASPSCSRILSPPDGVGVVDDAVSTSAAVEVTMVKRRDARKDMRRSIGDCARKAMTSTDNEKARARFKAQEDWRGVGREEEEE
jgi:hypothetical protein